MEKKEVKVVNTPTLNEYKPLKELTNEDCKNLPILKVNLIRSRSKFGESYKASFPLGLATLDIRNRFDQIAYLTILNCKGIDPTGSAITVNAYARFTRGLGKDGREYHAIQLIFGRDTFLTRFFNDRELILVNSWIKQGKMKPINWVNVPEKIGDEEFNINLGSDEMGD